MKYFVITIILTSTVVFTEASSYAYQINATRTGNTIAPGYPVLYMYYKVAPEQNLTYFMSIGPKNPLLIEGYLFNGDNVYYSNDADSLLNLCDNYQNGTWEYLITEIVKNGIIPNGTCSVDKGSYTAYQELSPISATLPEKINCGKYDLIFNAYVDNDGKNVWGCQLHYVFQIPSDDNCQE